MKNSAFITLIFITLVHLLLCSCSRNETRKQLIRNEKYRPQIHFSPEKNWMGAPTGLIYFNEEYHLFYEYNPSATTWGNIHWGHAVSKDLVHWKDCPIAIQPDSLGEIFSGSVILDTKNSSGLGTVDTPPLLAFYSQYDSDSKNKKHSVSIAYSIDGGGCWSKYEKNPLNFKNREKVDNSEPYVFWHESTRRWVMCLAANNIISFYSSSDCIHWSYMSDLKNDKANDVSWWEKPNLFRIKTRDETEEKWVLLVTNRIGPLIGASATQYIIGNFDGTRFVMSQRGTKDYDFWLDYGKDYSGTVACVDTRTNRIVSLGWMNCWEYAGQEPTNGWSGSCSFPRELQLIKDSTLYLLTTTPIAEIQTLSPTHYRLDKTKIGSIPTPIFCNHFSGDIPVDIRLNFDISTRHAISSPENYGIRLKNTKGDTYTIQYNNMNDCFRICRMNTDKKEDMSMFNTEYTITYIPQNNTCDWRIIIDRNAVEFFADNHRISITNTLYPTIPFDTIELFTDMGTINMLDASLNVLKSAWK